MVVTLLSRKLRYIDDISSLDSNGGNQEALKIDVTKRNIEVVFQYFFSKNERVFLFNLYVKVNRENTTSI